jgi:O-antigen/teichoic acid export membrane protein
MTRTKRAVFTYSTSLLFTAVTMIVGLVAVPLLLRWLGTERYGAFRATADWCGYLSLLELGIGGALLPLLAKAAGQNDKTTLQQTVVAGIRAYARVTAFMVLGGLVLIVSIRNLVPVSEGNVFDLRLAVFVAVLGLALTPLLPFQHLLQALQKGYRVNLLLLLQSLLITSSALLLAYSGWGITGQMMAVVLGGVFFFGTLTVTELRRYPLIRKAAFDKATSTTEWHQLWDLNRPTVVRQLCGRVSVMSDRIIVAALLGPAMVVPLFVTQRLAEFARSQVQSIGSATWAGLAELHATGEHEAFNERLLELTSLVAGLSMGILVPIVAYNRHFVGLWVGAEHYAGDLVTVVAGCGAFLLTITTIWDWVFDGTGRVARLLPVTIVSTTINLGLSLMLTLRFGVVGPLLGTLCAVAITNLWYVPVLLRRVFHVSPRRLVQSAAVPMAWGVPYAALAWWLGHSRPAVGWGGLALEMTSLAASYCLVWWLVMLKAADRDIHLARIRGLFGLGN